MKSYTEGISYLGREEWNGTGKAVTFNKGIGEGPTRQEAISAKVKRQAAKRLLGEGDVPKEVSRDGLKCHVLELVFD